MLKITIPGIEMYDELTSTFINSKECTLQLEHSLVSLSKWESKWEKPLLSKEALTNEETIDYIKCMTVTQNVDDMVYNAINKEHMALVYNYMSAGMTATKFYNNDIKKQINRETITAEIIYYWMIAMNIPFECQKWHLNRLLTLINVCSVKNTPKKSMSKKEILQRNAELNAMRRNSMNSAG